MFVFESTSCTDFCDETVELSNRPQNSIEPVWILDNLVPSLFRVVIPFRENHNDVSVQ